MESFPIVHAARRRLLLLCWTGILTAAPPVLAQPVCQHFYTVDGAVFEARPAQARVVCVRGERVRQSLTLDELNALPAPAAPAAQASARCPAAAAGRVGKIPPARRVAR